MNVTCMESRLRLCGLLSINILDIKITILEGPVEGLGKNSSYADLCKLFNNKGEFSGRSFLPPLPHPHRLLSLFVKLICCIVSEGAAEQSVSLLLFPMEQIPPSPPAAP